MQGPLPQPPASMHTAPPPLSFPGRHFFPTPGEGCLPVLAPLQSLLHPITMCHKERLVPYLGAYLVDTQEASTLPAPPALGWLELAVPLGTASASCRGKIH